MTPERFRRILWLSLAVPTGLVFLMAATVAFEVQQLRQALSWVDHTDAVIAETRGTLRRIVDAEDSLRGYLITGHPEFLNGWQNTNTIDRQFSHLHDMVHDNPEQQRRIEESSGLFHSWLTSSAELVELRKNGGDYAQIQRNLESTSRMNAVRDSFTRIIANEEALRSERLQHAGQLDQEFKFTLATLSIALTVTLALFSRYQLHNLSAQYDSTLLLANERAAAESERKQWFFTLLRSVGDAVIATDELGHITFMNPTAEVATAWSEHEARGEELSKVFRIVNADTHQTVEDPVAKVRRLNRVVGLANHTLLLRRDGSSIHIDDSGAPIRDEHGNLIGVILVFRDITKQYEMERTLRTTERLALAGRITASVAHEIYNPLDTVGNLLFLIQSDQERQHTAEYAEMASRELQRVNQVTRGLLSLYRESHTPVPVALADVVREVLSLLEMQIRHKSATVVCEGLEGVEVEGFPAELRQVFTNLLHNALDAIDRGGFIRVAGETQREGMICVSVTDNGMGIAAETLPRLFQPLFSTKGTEGTGLGLWVSKGIVEKHGGTIHVSSENAPELHGTTFSVLLPRRFPVVAPRLT